MADILWDIVTGLVCLGGGYFFQQELVGNTNEVLRLIPWVFYVAGGVFVLKPLLFVKEPVKAEPDILAAMYSRQETQGEPPKAGKSTDAGIFEILSRFFGSTKKGLLRILIIILVPVIIVGIYAATHPKFWIPGYTECHANMTQLQSAFMKTTVTNRISLEDFLISNDLNKRCPRGGVYIINHAVSRGQLSCTVHGDF